MAVKLDPTMRSESGWGSRRGRLAVVVSLALLLVLCGFLLGSHRSGTRVLTGPAQVGDHVVTMTVDETAYGFSKSMPWIDANDSYHAGGWPSCLGSMTSLPSVTFGVTRVDYPDGISADAVVYVDCRH